MAVFLKIQQLGAKRRFWVPYVSTHRSGSSHFGLPLFFGCHAHVASFLVRKTATNRFQPIGLLWGSHGTFPAAISVENFRYNSKGRQIWAWVKNRYLESPGPLKNGVITQNNGVIDPFLKGHGDSRYPKMACPGKWKQGRKPGVHILVV